MLQGKRSPFSLKVKTKRAKLYIVKRNDFTNLYENYKNIIKRISKKEKKHIKLIKNTLIKIIDRFCNVNGIKINEKYSNIINKAIKEVNKKMIPDVLKNTAISKSIIHDMDLEINKTIKEFSSKFVNYKIPIKSKKQNDIPLYPISNSNKEIFSLNNKNMKLTSFNLVRKNKSSKDLFKGFKSHYLDDYLSFSSQNLVFVL